MDEQKIIEKFEKIERRLNIIEGKKISQIKKNKKEKGFSGLAGGIRFLIKNGFLNYPKSVKEIEAELKREGYHYSYVSVDKLLRVNFCNLQKILNRIKEGVWKYVIRK